MATTDTGDLGTLTLVNVSVVDPDGTGENYIKVTFTFEGDSGDSLDGFLIWHDDESGSTTPVWVNACDAELAGSAGGSGLALATYEVLVPVPLATTGAVYWESFAEYANGAISAASMTGGGSIWDGAFASQAFYRTGSDDFESYSVGSVASASDLNAGTGWPSAFASHAAS